MPGSVTAQRYCTRNVLNKVADQRHANSHPQYPSILKFLYSNGGEISLHYLHVCDSVKCREDNDDSCEPGKARTRWNDLTFSDVLDFSIHLRRRLVVIFFVNKLRVNLSMVYDGALTVEGQWRTLLLDSDLIYWINCFVFLAARCIDCLVFSRLIQISHLNRVVFTGVNLNSVLRFGLKNLHGLAPAREPRRYFPF